MDGCAHGRFSEELSCGVATLGNNENAPRGAEFIRHYVVLFLGTFMSRCDALKECKSRRDGRANWQFALTFSEESSMSP